MGLPHLLLWSGHPSAIIFPFINSPPPAGSVTISPARKGYICFLRSGHNICTCTRRLWLLPYIYVDGSGASPHPSENTNDPYVFPRYSLNCPLFFHLPLFTLAVLKTQPQLNYNFMGLQRFMALLDTRPHCLQRYRGSVTSLAYIAVFRCWRPRLTR